MRALALRAAVAIGVACTVAAIGIGTRGSAPYRAAGMRLLEAAHPVGPARTLRQALSGPEPPLPVLLVRAGAPLSESLDGGLTGAAVVGALVAGGAAAVVVLLGWQLAGPVAGCMGGLLLLCFPGFLYHARTAGPEAAYALSVALLCWAGAAERFGPVRALAATAALTAALASSHEGLVLIIAWVLAIHLAGARPGRDPAAGTVTLAPILPGQLVPVLAAPLLLFWLWPYLEAETGTRAMAVFFGPYRAQHDPIVVAGEIRDQAIFRGPTTAQGLLLVLLRIPIITGALATLGAWRVLRPATDPTPARGGTFAVLALLTLVGVQALNGSPYYAGVDGVAALAPLLALLAGIGATAIWQAAQTLAPERLPWLRPRVGASVLLGLLVGPSLLAAVVAWPWGPGYANALVGGPAGAAARGFESLPDAAIPEGAVRWMNDTLPVRSRVASVAATHRYRPLLDGLRRRGVLRPDIEASDTFNATHLLVPRAPAWPLYRDALGWLGEPAWHTDHHGVRVMAIHAF